MAIVGGVAIKNNGQPVDYVLLFDWETGAFIAKSVPNQFGEWEHDLIYSATCGITYVADGCKPISHGSYALVGDYAEGVPSGYLYLSWISRTANYTATYDKTATGSTTWPTYFKPVLDFDTHKYYVNPTTSAVGNVPVDPTIINSFALWWNIKIYAYGASGRSTNLDATFEVLDKNNNVIFAIKIYRLSSYYTAMSYGANLSSLTKTPHTGVALSNGTLTFTETRAIWTSVGGSNHNESFNFAANFTNAVKVRVSGTTYVTNGNEGVYMLLLPRTI